MNIESRPDTIIRRMRVSVIREEFLELTGHPFRAILLNQLYYWTQKVKDFDDLITEEKERVKDCNIELRHGWLYKSAPAFIKETLLNVSKHTFYRHMRFLQEKGWIETKDKSESRWDKTTSYRLNLKLVQDDLKSIGFDLPAVFQDSYQKMAQTSMSHNETSKSQPAPSMSHNATSKDKIINKKEDTGINILNKHTYKTESVRASARDINDDESKEEISDSSLKTFIDLWYEIVKKELPLTPEREKSLSDVISEFFKNDPDNWAEFCQNVKDNDSLNGKGPSGWMITLDWVSQKKNIVKILNKIHPMKKEETVLLKKDEKLKEEALRHIEGIKDNVWKEVVRTVLLNWAPSANVPYSSPYFEGLYKRKGQNIYDIETFLRCELWKAKLGSLSDRVTLLYLGQISDFNFKTHYQEAVSNVIKQIYPHIQRVNWTLDANHFNEHWHYFEQQEGEKRRDL